MREEEDLERPYETLRRTFGMALDACGVTQEQQVRAWQKMEARHGKRGGVTPGMHALQSYAAALEEVTGDPALGLKVGASMAKGATGVVEYALLTAPSLRSAHQLYARLGVLVDESVGYEIREEGGYAFIELIPPSSIQLERVLLDYRFMRLLSVIRRAFRNPDFRPSGVAFTYPKPDDLSVHRELLGTSVDLQFGQPRAALQLLASDLDVPLVDHDPLLHRIVVHSAEHLLKTTPTPTSLASKVGQVITATLHRGRPSVGDVARSLGMSERSLRRSLAREGTSFASVLDDVRARMLEVLAQERKDNPKAVAAQLGFQDTRALRRAERRWAGGKPSTPYDPE